MIMSKRNLLTLCLVVSCHSLIDLSTLKSRLIPNMMIKVDQWTQNLNCFEASLYDYIIEVIIAIEVKVFKAKGVITQQANVICPSKVALSK